MAIDIGIYPYKWDAELVSLTNKSTSFISRTAFGYIISNDARLAGIRKEDTNTKTNTKQTTKVIKGYRVKKRW